MDTIKNTVAIVATVAAGGAVTHVALSLRPPSAGKRTDFEADMDGSFEQRRSAGNLTAMPVLMDCGTQSKPHTTSQSPRHFAAER